MNTATKVAIGDKLSRSLQARHIPKLDALRAVSALLVMLYHFGLPIPAGFGVTCFFVISGFLITWLLLDEQDRTGSISLRGFYARRAFRIFPAFYVYWALVTAWLILHHRHLLWGQAASSFLYLCNYYQGLHHYPSSAYSRTWSLAVEEQFYLLWPLLFCRMAANRGNLLKTLGIIISSIWVCRILLWTAGADEAYLYTAFECRADAILVGCALALGLRSGRLRRTAFILCNHWLNLALSIAMLGLSLVFHRTYGTAYRDTVAHIVEPLLIGVVIVQLLGIDSRMLDWLDARPLRYIGLISYSTYLYHGLIPVPESYPVVLKTIPSYVVAAMSYHVVEKPFLRLRDRWFGALPAL